MLELIGKELEIIRLRCNKSIRDVASDLNLNQETIRRYEKNASGLSVSRLNELLKYYNVDITIFFSNIREYNHNN